ncbi:MAG: hypothetical protein PHO70_05630 [Candidatus Omnitrophica bacterium]|nr:hypothetical protein [Candidatus Omnitrophota bacterium]
MKKYLLVVLFLLPVYAFATKDCEYKGVVCEKNLPIYGGNVSGKYSEEKCLQVSDWIAVGTIENIEHNFKTDPLNKDFATFTFVVREWIKGGNNQVKILKFTVGWCKNPTVPPENSQGLYEIFGVGEPKLAPLESEYLHFEPYEAKK